jgi:hypothetical protein
MAFLIVFYAALCAWTVVSAAYLGPGALSGSWPLGRFFMIGFVVAFTWYFSVGIAYRVRLSEGGHMEITSLRRRILLNASEILQIEGPRMAILPVGFLRIRWEGERHYLFCRFGSKALEDLLKTLKIMNSRVTIKFMPA